VIALLVFLKDDNVVIPFRKWQEGDTITVHNYGGEVHTIELELGSAVVGNAAGGRWRQGIDPDHIGQITFCREQNGPLTAFLSCYWEY
jgi:hypothetical protein